MKITKSLSPRVLVALAPTVSYFPGQDAIDASIGTSMLFYNLYFNCFVVLALSLQLAHNWQGSLAFGTGMRTSYISTTILRTELNQQQCSFNLTVIFWMNLMDSTAFIFSFLRSIRFSREITYGVFLILMLSWNHLVCLVLMVFCPEWVTSNDCPDIHELAAEFRLIILPFC